VTHPHLPGPFDDRSAVVVEARVSQMTVGIYQHSVPDMRV
jgi:hypothetical protein